MILKWQLFVDVMMHGNIVMLDISYKDCYKESQASLRCFHAEAVGMRFPSMNGMTIFIRHYCFLANLPYLLISDVLVWVILFGIMSVWSCSTGRLLNINLLFSEMLCKNNIRLITMHLISQHEYECNSALIYCVSKCVWRVKEQIDRGIWMLLTVSVHHPHLAPTCMQSPQDKALALMHSLPSAEQKRRRELHIYSFD